MNNVRNIFIIVALLSVTTTIAVAAQERFRIMEYNVENMFDTLPNPERNERSFLPDGANKWTPERYWAKLGRLARAIVATGGDVPVDLIGLVEVESDTVLTHLTQRTSLARLGYDYLLTDGLDERGMNVALLYQRGRFRPLRNESLRVPVAVAERPTRDVLFVEGLLPTLDTLAVFVAHFPSRRGGKQVAEAQRCRAATLVRQKVDSIQFRRPDALIVIMGDLNDEVQDASLKESMGVLPAEVYEEETRWERKSSQALYDLTPSCVEHPSVCGTYYYQQEWNLLDHIIVSASLLNGAAPLFTPTGKSRILAYPFLVEQGDTPFSPEVRPKRTYLGTHYHGGVSDHFPLQADFVLKGFRKK